MISPHSHLDYQLKGQLHCHSTSSDGINSPATIITAYRDAGYDFSVLSDHNVWTPDPAVSGILFFQATEISVINPSDIHSNHFSGVTAVSYNHPAWSYGACGARLSIWKGFLEIGYAADMTLFDQMLTRGCYPLYCTRVDDCHDITAPNFNVGYVLVDCEEKSVASVQSNLEKGNFYASNGNDDLLVEINGSDIIASSAAESTFEFFGRCGTLYKTESGVTSSTYTPDGTEKYIRITATNSAGKVCNSQAIFV